MKKTMALLATATALGLAACGDDEESSEEAETAITPDQAIEEISEVQGGLADAQATYAKGDAETAAETVNETYLQHFELVEVPLEEADAELNEELEEQIREELVAEIEAGAPPADVSRLIAEIEKGLAEAETTLAQEGAAG